MLLSGEKLTVKQEDVKDKRKRFLFGRVLEKDRPGSVLEKERPAQSLELPWGRASRLQRCSGSAATEQDLCKTVIATSKVNWATT